MKPFLKNKRTIDTQQIIHDWEQFEKNGHIGDCALRKLAQEYIEHKNMSAHYITLIMKDLTFEILLRHYKKSSQSNYENSR
jgi:hypothetical protein